MSTDISNPMLEKVDRAITNLKRGNHKLTIAGIAKKAGIERKTIYNRPDLKERCTQAIAIQKELVKGPHEVDDGVKLKSSENLADQKDRLKRELEKVKNGNAKLLENNRKLVLEKHELLAQIESMQELIKELRNKKVAVL
ncbi:hypothetical protein A8990_11968 [Paenibacillus taihuensis]|uniref:Transposase n=1 Tax=Paenibacillus taihuensis TaxID=1156355 RepID=A0A3D9RUL2_9BACL|nr:DUF6262 family protein [Paenibacillus taihuensis]REE81234.1 hypothetical protein A8990_11968 [Paenibacillus taihuensis]